MARVLLIEDNNDIQEILYSLLSEDHEVLQAFSGTEGLRLFQQEAVDLVLLDIMLPGKNGDQVLEEIRLQSQVPVIMMTALGDKHLISQYLLAGANDYIVKPFSNMELLMRVKAILRRSARGTAPAQEEKKSHIPFGDLILDLECQSVLRQGEVIVLTYTEFKILELLVTHKKKIYSLENIYQSIWEEDAVGDSAIMVHIKNIRKKLEDDSRNPRYIKTAWGRGYYVDQ